MNYEVLFENDSIVEIKANNVSFYVDKRIDTLYKLINAGGSTDIVIPHTFPSGHQIKYLYSASDDGESWEGWKECMIQGVFNEIAISDNILVGSQAFRNAEVKKVVWNDCSYIPSFCFQDSKIEEIANIKNVKKVTACAFMSSNIKEIVWPEHCYTIPWSCFKGCKQLSKLSVPYVKEIESYAFAYSGIATFDWPSECSYVPSRCFMGSKLSKINNLNEVRGVGEQAFAGANLRTLDLSDTNVSCLAPNALFGLSKKCKITQPYYVSGEDFTNALGLNI